MKRLWRHIAYNYGEGGVTQILLKILYRIRLWAWSETTWLVYRADLTRYERAGASTLVRRQLDFDDLRRVGYFKAAIFPEATRERLAAPGLRCHGFFRDGELATIDWTTQGRLELEPGWEIGGEACGGIYDCYTLPAHRSKGYYRDSLILLNQMMKSEGARESFIAVASDNIPSIKGIERAGFEPLCTARRRRRLGREFFDRMAFAHDPAAAGRHAGK